jgi:hypothetical protein
MYRRTLPTLVLAALVSLLAVFGLATPAAAVTRAEKLSLLSSWTQTSSSSYQAWNSGRLNKSAWSEYDLNWSTDYCSSSPDNPLGFNFKLSCYRHDFGYRNYKEMGVFSSHKDRLDSAFYEDLRRVCATYSVWVRPACYSLAWTYYQAVRAFGSPVITSEQLKAAAELKAAGEAQMAAALG